MVKPLDGVNYLMQIDNKPFTVSIWTTVKPCGLVMELGFESRSD